MHKISKAEYYQKLITAHKMTIDEIHDLIMDDKEMQEFDYQRLLAFCMGIISYYRKEEEKSIKIFR